MQRAIEYVDDNVNDPKSIPDARSAAARIVCRWIRRGEYPSRMLADVKRNHGFVLEVVQGTMRWYRALDFYRRKLAPAKPRPELHALLLTGLYQLFYMDRTETRAVVHEAVRIAKQEIGEWAGRVCNAVLRRAIREQQELEAALAKEPFPTRVSHPDGLISRWQLRFDADELHALCRWNNLRPEVIARVNPARATMEDFLAGLRKAGIRGEPHPFAPAAFATLPSGVGVREIPGFNDGHFHIADPSTSAATELLDVRPGQRVLDLCAAPGGKAAALAAALAGDGTLVACEFNEGSRSRLRQNLQRLGFDRVQTIRVDATRADHLEDALRESAPDGFDRILLDVPCSNTGVLRRRPDARWRFSEDSLTEIASLQRTLLDHAAPWLRVDGLLVYSTCSLEPEENHDQVEQWVADHPEWRIANESELIPTRTRTDGAFAARLIRGPPR